MEVRGLSSGVHQNIHLSSSGVHQNIHLSTRMSITAVFRSLPNPGTGTGQERRSRKNAGIQISFHPKTRQPVTSVWQSHKRHWQSVTRRGTSTPLHRGRPSQYLPSSVLRVYRPGVEGHAVLLIDGGKCLLRRQWMVVNCGRRRTHASQWRGSIVFQGTGRLRYRVIWPGRRPITTGH